MTTAKGVQTATGIRRQGQQKLNCSSASYGTFVKREFGVVAATFAHYNIEPCMQFNPIEVGYSLKVISVSAVRTGQNSLKHINNLKTRLSLPCQVGAGRLACRECSTCLMATHFTAISFWNDVEYCVLVASPTINFQIVQTSTR